MIHQECRVCGNNTGNTLFAAQEMMFGFRDAFNYLRCSSCGLIQIETIPENIGSYYPAGYYSFSANDAARGSFKSWRQKLVYKHHFANSFLGALVACFSSKPEVWMKRDVMKFNDKILDVGSGAGKLLLKLSAGGFKNLTGIDPYIAQDITYDNGVKILKRDFLELQETFDFIMLHHSFEHMGNPEEILKQIHALLNPQCYALIRIPVADSHSWRKYGANWVNLDPPRHFYLHTTVSMSILVEQSGLKIADVVYDSDKLQFYGSELYLRNVPLHEYHQGKHQHVFSKQQMREFRKEANRLNKLNDGDWACFFIYKP